MRTGNIVDFYLKNEIGRIPWIRKGKLEGVICEESVKTCPNMGWMNWNK